MKRTITLLILAAMLLQCAACGSGETPSTGDTTSANGTTTAETTAETDPYDYPDLDCGGETFTIMNIEPMWNMNTELDFDAQNGETLDDAIYTRNRMLEDKFNFKLEEVQLATAEYFKLADHVRTDVMSGDAQYDACYTIGSTVGSLITEGSVMNLLDIDTLQLDQPWWNQITNEQSTIGGDYLYFTQSNLSLTAFDLTWCLFFNESMMEEKSLEAPYDLVREGNWTIDELHKLCKAGANLNGDESFTFAADGKSVYGYSTYNNGALASIIGLGITFTGKDASDMPTFDLETDRFYTAIEKLATLCASEGDFYQGVTGSNPDRYTTVFANRRALFVGAEVKDALVFRDFEDTFGIVPNPKLDEAQANYYSWTNYLAPVLVVPVTTKDASRTGALLDVMSYYSYRDVLPVYYDVTLAQKGLRNEDSIEMMDIIRDSLCFDPSMAYGWTTKLAESIRDAAFKGDSNVASLIASNKTTVEESITKMLDELE
ncbi:MAG: extracellular solute-binding protein [Clostridia bacterium]|nr:extracellular solute-binding protein [Clostridia bacterium]